MKRAIIEDNYIVDTALRTRKLFNCGMTSYCCYQKKIHFSNICVKTPFTSQLSYRVFFSSTKTGCLFCTKNKSDIATHTKKGEKKTFFKIYFRQQTASAVTLHSNFRGVAPPTTIFILNSQNKKSTMQCNARVTKFF